MTSREKGQAIFERRSNGAGTLWVGHPNEKILPICADAWGIEPTREAIYTYLNDDCRWIRPDGTYRHPEGHKVFDPSWGRERHSLSAEGCFANAEKPSDLDAYPWPNVDYFNFDETYAEVDAFQDKLIFTGMWCPFYHLVADFFGMENYFIKMYEAPAVVEALTERIVDFYVEANTRYFERLGNRADVMFFGNDFGTQLDLFISPEMFKRFVLPSFKRLVAVGKRFGKRVLLHSCGSIYRVIPMLIEAGVDALHPIQAAAAGMSAAELAQYKNDLAFVGGIDAQTFFVNSTPEQIKAEVCRVRDILGPNLIVSPSHEEILPNVPTENLVAMAEAALEK